VNNANTELLANSYPPKCNDIAKLIKIQAFARGEKWLGIMLLLLLLLLRDVLDDGFVSSLLLFVIERAVVKRSKVPRGMVVVAKRAAGDNDNDNDNDDDVAIWI
jgi:hypothetical protein